ncbi:alpha/beta fold hydrolase [Clostridium bovifaecis]|uniref:Alpha/beta fold hydrolase n=1 Tax=Clostridium bovifaecis TaxID=2184719 RepID=A0A6I6F5I7_9CLOT|nr:alpha/beta fold hydrolase [Clostridium bovifaecis]
MLKEILLNTVKIQNGETIAYRESGSGDKILILIHGNMTSSKHWDLLIESLPENYKIYAPDLRGMGMSSYNNEINSIKDFSEDVKAFLHALGLKEVYIAGWSTGGCVAMQLAADYPESIKKLILVESGGIKGYPVFKKDENGKPIFTQLISTKEELSKDFVQVLPILNAYARRDKEFLKTIWKTTIYTHNEPSSEKFDEYMEDMMTQRNLVDLDYALITFNISHEHNGVVPGNGDVDKIICPTLILQGERDMVVPPVMGQDIKDGIGDNATLTMLPCGHSPLIDCLDRLTEEIVHFTK